MLDAVFWILERVLPVGFLLTGAALTIAGAVMAWRRVATLARGVVVTGAISRWERQRDADDPQSFFYFPHVAFEDRAGVSREIRIDRGYSAEKWPVGTAFDVRYDPDNPARAYTAHPVGMLIGAGAVLLLGLSALWVWAVRLG